MPDWAGASGAGEVGAGELGSVVPEPGDAGALPRPREAERHCTLLLGWPSSVAQAVIEPLLARGDVIVLVPEETEPEGLPPPRVERLHGRPSAIDFGLSGLEYTQLTRRVTQVVVAAIHRDGVRDIERARAVREAAELVEFVQAGGGRSGVVYLSSLLALGSPEQPALEGELELGQSFFSKFEESLAVAERMVRRVGRYTPLMVLRTAPVSGWEDSGRLDPEAPLARLARRIQVGALAAEVAYRDEPVRFECVEPVARLLVRLLESGVPKTVHLADRVPMTDRRLVEFLLGHFGKSLERGVSVPFRLRLTLPDVVAAHTVLGWRSRFDLSEAERTCPDLLDRDPMARLRRFFPDRKDAPGAAGAGASRTSASLAESGDGMSPAAGGPLRPEGEPQ